MKIQLPYRISCCVLVLLATSLAKPVLSQQAFPEELAPSLAKINEENVTKTIQFLSSDEMAGRLEPVGDVLGRLGQLRRGRIPAGHFV